MRIINLVGERFGRLVVVERAASPNNNARWKCRCDCGRFSTVYGMDLRKGKQISCGCAQAERRFKHGMARSPVYRVWIQMRSRCSNPNDLSWHNYGGRGITVCDEWNESFERFMADMGPRPKGYQIERIDNNLGYSPSNCTWATAKQQRNNQRNNRIIEVDGVKKTMQQWADDLGLSRSTVRSRIERYGWDVKSAVTLPTQAGRALGTQGRYD